MANDANPFGEFEEDFKNTEKAPPGVKLYPEGTYNFVCTTHDLKGDGVLVDHETFVSKNKGTKAFKLFCEVLSPEVVKNEKGEDVEMKGVVIEKVFWVTKNTLGRIMWDLAQILGRDLTSMGEVVKITWAGRTFQGVLRHEGDDKGVLRNQISFINPWKPEDESASKGASDGAKTAETKKVEKSGAAKSADKGVSF